MKQLDRKKINRMVDQQAANGGGNGAYTPPTTTDVAWANISGKPTTISGYGITDAYWAEQTQTSDRRNLTIGSVTQQVITAHQSLSGYATEQWVTNKGYIDSSGSCAYATSAGSAGSATSAGYATSAGSATNDSDGNQISTTYLKLSGGTVTGNLQVNGVMGVGGISSSYKLYVAGKIQCTGGFGFLSDINKKDVIDYEQKLSVEDIANAPLIHYTLKDNKEDKSVHVGSVAQYWEKKLPETVLKDKEGTLSMQYDVQALTSAVILARKVVEMEKEIEELKALINNGK